MVNIERILCPVDLSVFSRDALHHALALARWYEAQVKSPSSTSTVPLSRLYRSPAPPETYRSRRWFNPARPLKKCAGSAPLHSDNRGNPSTSS